jgi:hypothetical protein
VSDIGGRARDFHRDALNWDPRRQASPIQQAHDAGDQRMRTLQDEYAKRGKSLLLYAPDEIARKVESMARVAQYNERTGSTDSWASLIAVCLAGWVAAALAEEHSIVSGDEAA